jgi:F-type H+-transporting ATPase subunit delta
VFHAERWACAFIGALDTKAEVGLVCLKKLVGLLKPVKGVLFGRSIAESIEESLSKEFVVQKDHSNSALLEHVYSIRFVSLLIEKNLFRNIDLIIKKIEKMLDEKNGVLEVLIETSSTEDKTFEDELSKMIMINTGASKIKMSTKLVPELIAGYRLRMGGLSIDASLKNQLEQMTANLIDAKRNV